MAVRKYAFGQFYFCGKNVDLLVTFVTTFQACAKYISDLMMLEARLTIFLQFFVVWCHCMIFGFGALPNRDGSHLESILSKRNEEINLVKSSVENTIKTMQSRNNMELLNAMNRIGTYKVENNHMNYVDISADFSSPSTSKSKSTVTVGSTNNKAPKSAVASVLDRHNVETSLINEINSMSTSYIPRETIIKHVQTHYPDKKASEINDIVISAIQFSSQKHPKEMDIKNANRINAKVNRRKFEAAKQKLTNQININDFVNFED